MTSDRAGTPCPICGMEMIEVPGGAVVGSGAAPSERRITAFVTTVTPTPSAVADLEGVEVSLGAEATLVVDGRPYVGRVVDVRKIDGMRRIEVRLDDPAHALRANSFGELRVAY